MKSEKNDNFHAKMFSKLQTDHWSESTFKYILASERHIDRQKRIALNNLKLLITLWTQIKASLRFH